MFWIEDEYFTKASLDHLESLPTEEEKQFFIQEMLRDRIEDGGLMYGL